MMMRKKILSSAIAILNFCILLSAQTLDKKFYTTNGAVYATFVQGDTVYIGGNFTRLGIGAQGTARFKPGNTRPDTNFPELGTNNNYVEAIESDDNGGFYLGGRFTSYNGEPIESTSVIHVLKNGTKDPDFRPVVCYDDFSVIASALALKKKGERLYVGGDFYTIQGVQRPCIAALNATTGKLENWKSSVSYSYVNKVDASDSLVFVIGGFNFEGHFDESNFAALDATTGMVFTDFPSTFYDVSAFKVDSNSLYIGGGFNSLGYRKGGLGKASSSNASLIPKFPTTDGIVWAILPDKNGGYYIGGSFNYVNDKVCNNVAHVLADGNVDASFHADADNTVYALAMDNTNLYIGGSFVTANGSARNHVASVTLSKGLLTAFNPDVNGTVRCLAYKDNTLYIGGVFSLVKGTARSNAAAVGTDNTIKSWAPDANRAVNNIILNNNGTSAFLAGEFWTIKGVAHPYLARVNTTTGSAFSWSPTIGGFIKSMALDGSILYIKGQFVSINNIARQSLAAIDTSSVSPTSFKADVNDVSSGYNSLSIVNKKLYVVGSFTKIQDSLRTNIARIDITTGKVDTWNINNPLNPNDAVVAVAAQNSDVAFGGLFNYLSPTPRPGLAEIDLKGNSFTIKSWKPNLLNYKFNDVYDILHYKNSVYVSGDFSYDTSTSGVNSGITMKYVMSLNDVTGKISHQFTEYPNTPAYLLCIYDNKLMLGGYFTDFNLISNAGTSYPRLNLAGYNLTNYRLSPDKYDPDAVQDITTDNSGNLLVAGCSLINCVDRPYLASMDVNTGLPTAWNPSPDAPVLALAAKDSVLFAGGQFVSLGKNGLNRKYVAAINILTGKPIKSWSANANNSVVTLSVKGNILYAGGNFTRINNTNRKYAAALSTNDAVVQPWNPTPNDAVTTILPLNNYVYLGGKFTKAKAKNHNYIAKVNNTSGDVTAWEPDLGGYPFHIASSGRDVFVSGSFRNVGAQARFALAAFDSASNALTDFDAKINNNSSSAEIHPFATYGKYLYFGAGETFQSIGTANRGFIAGIDTARNRALAFNPMPDNNFSSYNSPSGNSFTVAKNNLFVGGNWIGLGTYVSPAYFAVFTLPALEGLSNNLLPVAQMLKSSTFKISSSYSIYPNPAHAECTVTFTGESTESYHLTLVDINGRVLKEINTTAIKGINKVHFKTSDLSNGNYLINISSKSGLIKSLKLVKH